MVDRDAGLHTLRHTFLTEAGEHTDAFTLQYIAGHDTIKTTMRYVHPRAESVSRGARADQSEKEASGVGVGIPKQSHESSGKSAASVGCKERIQKRIH